MSVKCEHANLSLMQSDVDVIESNVGILYDKIYTVCTLNLCFQNGCIVT